MRLGGALSALPAPLPPTTTHSTHRCAAPQLDAQRLIEQRVVLPIAQHRRAVLERMQRVGQQVQRGLVGLALRLLAQAA